MDLKNNHKIGLRGEEIASGYLQKKGYRILHRNYRCILGEIDIIGEYQGYIIFIEVKYRRSTSFGFPFESVGKKKQKKIRQVANTYLLQTKQYGRKCRFDVVSILEENSVEVMHFENAF